MTVSMSSESRRSDNSLCSFLHLQMLHDAPSIGCSGGVEKFFALVDCGPDFQDHDHRQGDGTAHFCLGRLRGRQHQHLITCCLGWQPLRLDRNRRCRQRRRPLYDHEDRHVHQATRPDVRDRWLQQLGAAWPTHRRNAVRSLLARRRRRRWHHLHLEQRIVPEVHRRAELFGCVAEDDRYPGQRIHRCHSCHIW
jgi:hypothetical protein